MKWAEMSAAQKNALVAEKVMGLRIHRYEAQRYIFSAVPFHAVLIDGEDTIIGDIPDYLSSMTLAWTVFQSICERATAWEKAHWGPGTDETFKRFAEAMMPNDPYKYSDDEPEQGYGAHSEVYPAYDILPQIAEWTPEFICKSALYAVGALEEEENTDG